MRSDLLRAHDPTERETGVVVTWLGHPEWSRLELARHFGIGEGTVRNLLGRVRAKLNCDTCRGSAALRERIDQIATTARSRDDQGDRTHA